MLRRLGPPGDPAAIGLDACSPGEVLHGLECGFLPQEITYTGTNISERDLEEAVARAARHGLTIDTAHFHLANGMLDDELPVFDQALGEGARLVRRLVDASCPLREVNVGGGLGMPLHEGERPMDLDAYAGNINEGDYLSGEDVAFPEVAEGDIVAMVGIGGYCQSMCTDHCGRPRAGALFLEERA